MASESNLPIGVFTTGCIVGLVLAYTNFVGFLAGVVTGIFIQTSGPDLGNGILLFVINAASRTSSVVKPLLQPPPQTSTEKEE